MPTHAARCEGLGVRPRDGVVHGDDERCMTTRRREWRRSVDDVTADTRTETAFP
jgi:hypothetical protein